MGVYRYKGAFITVVMHHENAKNIIATLHYDKKKAGNLSYLLFLIDY